MTHGHSTLQAMPSQAARFCLGVERFLTRELELDLTGAKLVVGFSGGGDSTGLLLALHGLSSRLDITLTAAHVDHGLRPESGQDAAFCRQVCAGLNIPLRETRVDVAALAQERKLGLEEAGREARHAFFHHMLEETQGDWIALGHTLNDLAEDALMRLTRGAGWPELAGMDAVDDGRRLLRPLLLTPREDIREFLRALQHPWREDPTNQDPSFRRNRLRAQVVPVLADENPGFVNAVARLWRTARQDRAALDHLMRQVVTDHPEGLLLPREALKGLLPSLRLRAMKRGLERLGPGQPLFATLQGLERAFAQESTGKVFQFPGNKTATVTRDGIVLAAHPKAPD